MDVACSNHVVTRSSFGRFISQCDVAGDLTMKDIADAGADLSRSFAPKGHKADPRTPKLVDSITSSASGNRAHWQASARHALPQETGATSHPITGNVSFFWEKKWRMWEPGDNTINHPGNPAHPYLRPAYEEIMATWMGYAKKYYPG